MINSLLYKNVSATRTELFSSFLLFSIFNSNLINDIANTHTKVGGTKMTQLNKHSNKKGFLYPFIFMTQRGEEERKQLK